MIINNKPVRILAIDPGFDRMGVAILDKIKGKETLVYSTCITTSKKESFESRLFFAGNTLEEIIIKYSPNHLAIEKLFFTANQRTAMNVAEVRGVCLFFAKKYKLSIFEYTPPQIKIAVTGYGKSNKSDISNMVYKIIKIPNKEKLLDDEIDAIAIGLTHSASVKFT